jgi:transposase
MDIHVLGIDLGKNSCSVVGLDPTGRVLLRRRMRRESIVGLAAKLPGCVVAMEACCGAHHLGRLLAAQGHEVRLMSPEYVRPYVKAQKNDDRDAEAIAEAATRPTMRFVALKTEAQLDVQVLHRVRDRLVSQRTALMNQIRSILLERGIVVPKGRRKLLDALSVLSGESERSGVGPRVRLLLDDMLDQWRGLDRRIAALDDEFAEMARNDPAARRLATIPGVGVLNAPRWLPRSPMGAPSTAGAISRPGWGWCRVKQRRAASQSCSGSLSAVVNICASSSSRGREPLCPGCPERRHRLVAGCAVC